MHNDIEDIRRATLENNLTWLRSFGCEVSREENLTSINHPHLPGFNVRLIFGHHKEALKHLRTVLSRVAPTTEPPDIYVDEMSNSRAFRSQLRHAGYFSTSVNATRFGNWIGINEKSAVSLQPASASEFEDWAALYSAGFGRFGQEAEYDHYRWQLSFKSKNLKHWFVVEDGTKIGVCQTCADSGVVGIYSFTLGSMHRGIKKLRPAIRALRTKLTEKGEAAVYFERLWNKDLLNKQHIADDPYGFKVIRIMTGYSYLK